MIAATGTATTANGGKYVRQLCKHWAHELEVELDGDTGVVRFPTATAAMAAREDAIALSITGEDAGEIERLKAVIERHLDRFAFREAPLRYVWAIA